MSKQVFMYSDRKAAEIKMDLPDYSGEFSIVSQFTRRDNGSGHKMSKPPKGSCFDPAAESTRIFNLLQLGDDKDHLYCLEIGWLNSKPGFDEVIELVKGGFMVKDGAKITISGGETVFALTA
jgi:hypothetical protein